MPENKNVGNGSGARGANVEGVVARMRWSGSVRETVRACPLKRAARSRSQLYGLLFDRFHHNAGPVGSQRGPGRRYKILPRQACSKKNC